MSSAPMSKPALQSITIDLFLYTLQNGLGDSPEKIDETRQNFWRGIFKNGQLTETVLAEVTQRENSFDNSIDLLPQRCKGFALPHDGFYYPVMLGDTLAVQVDYSGQLHDAEWDALPLAAQLQQMQTCVLEHAEGIPDEVGRSWFIWGRLVDATQNPEEMARYIFEHLNICTHSHWSKAFKGRGTLRGASLFAVEQNDTVPDGVNQNQYALICLFPENCSKDEADEIIRSLHLNWMLLFFYRNKILRAYEKGLLCRANLKKAAATFQRLTNTALQQHAVGDSVNLTKLQKDLVDAMQLSHLCGEQLSLLKQHIETIVINLNNYRQKLQEMAESGTGDDIKFLEKFTHLTHDKYLKQLRTDEQTLTISLKPLQSFVHTISSITELEKAKNDRTLNQTIAIASVGISVASLTASTFTEQAKEIVSVLNPSPSSQTVPVSNAVGSAGLALAVSLAIGLLGASITWLLSRSWNRR